MNTLMVMKFPFGKIALFDPSFQLKWHSPFKSFLTASLEEVFPLDSSVGSNMCLEVGYAPISNKEPRMQRAVSSFGGM